MISKAMMNSAQDRLGGLNSNSNRHRDNPIMGEPDYSRKWYTPIYIGMSTINGIRFLLLDIAGGVIWAITFSLIGYFSGHALQYLLLDIRFVATEIIIVLALAGLFAWIFYFYYRYKKK